MGAFHPMVQIVCGCRVQLRWPTTTRYTLNEDLSMHLLPRLARLCCFGLSTRQFVSPVHIANLDTLIRARKEK